MGYKNQRKLYISLRKKSLLRGDARSQNIGGVSRSGTGAGTNVQKKRNALKKSLGNAGKFNTPPGSRLRAGFYPNPNVETLAIGQNVPNDVGLYEDMKLKDDPTGDVGVGMMDESMPGGQVKSTVDRWRDMDKAQIRAEEAAGMSVPMPESSIKTALGTGHGTQAPNSNSSSNVASSMAGNAGVGQETTGSPVMQAEVGGEDVIAQVAVQDAVDSDMYISVYGGGSAGNALSTITVSGIGADAAMVTKAVSLSYGTSDSRLKQVGVSTYRPEIIACLNWQPLDFEVGLPDKYGSGDGLEVPKKTQSIRELLQFRIREHYLYHWWTVNQIKLLNKSAMATSSGAPDPDWNNWLTMSDDFDALKSVVLYDMEAWSAHASNFLHAIKDIEDLLNLKAPKPILANEVQPQLDRYYDGGDFPPTNASGIYGYFEKFLAIGEDDLAIMSDTKILAQLMYDLKHAARWHSPGLFDTLEYTLKDWRSARAQYNEGSNPIWEINPKRSPREDIYSFRRQSWGWMLTPPGVGGTTGNVTEYEGYINFVESLPKYGDLFGSRLMYSNRIKLLAVALGKEFTNSASSARMLRFNNVPGTSLKRWLHDGVRVGWQEHGTGTAMAGTFDVFDRALGSDEALKTNWGGTVWPGSVQLYNPAAADDGSIANYLNQKMTHTIGAGKNHPRVVDTLQIQNAGYKLDNESNQVLPLEKRWVRNAKTDISFAPGYDLFFRSLFTPGKGDEGTWLGRDAALLRTRAWSDYTKVSTGAIKNTIYLLRQHSGLNHTYDTPSAASNEYFSTTPVFVYREFLRNVTEIVATVARQRGEIEAAHRTVADLDPLSAYPDVTIDADDYGSWTHDQLQYDQELDGAAINTSTMRILLLMKIIEQDDDPKRSSTMRYRLFQLFLVFRDAYLHNITSSLFDGATPGSFPRPWRPSSCATRAWSEISKGLTIGATTENGWDVGEGRQSGVLWGDFVGSSDDSTLGGDLGRGMAGHELGNANTREYLINELATYGARRMSHDDPIAVASVTDLYQEIDASYLNPLIVFGELMQEYQPYMGGNSGQLTWDTLEDQTMSAGWFILPGDLSDVVEARNMFRHALRGAFLDSDTGGQYGIGNLDWGSTGGGPEHKIHNATPIFKLMYQMLIKLQKTANVQAALDPGETPTDGDPRPEACPIEENRSYLTVNSTSTLLGNVSHTLGTRHLAPNYSLTWTSPSRGTAGTAADDEWGHGQWLQGQDPTGSGEQENDFDDPAESPDPTVYDVLMSPILTRWSGYDDNTLCAMVFEMFWSFLVSFVSVGTGEIRLNPEVFNEVGAPYNPDQADNVIANELVTPGEAYVRWAHVNLEANRQLVAYLAVQWKLITYPSSPWLAEFWPGSTDYADNRWGGGITSEWDDHATNNPMVANAGTLLHHGDADLGTTSSLVLNSLGILANTSNTWSGAASTMTLIYDSIFMNNILKNSAPTYQWVWLDDVRYRLAQEDQMILEGCAMLHAFGKNRIQQGNTGGTDGGDIGDFSTRDDVWQQTLMDFGQNCCGMTDLAFDDTTLVLGALVMNTNSSLTRPVASSVYGLDWAQLNLKRFKRAMLGHRIAGQEDGSAIQIATLPDEFTYGWEADTRVVGGKELAYNNNALFNIFSVIFGSGGWYHGQENNDYFMTAAAYVNFEEPWGRNIKILSVGIPRGMIDRYQRSTIQSDWVYTDTEWEPSRSAVIRINVRRRDLMYPGLVFRTIGFDFDMSMFLDLTHADNHLLSLLNSPPSAAQGVSIWELLEVASFIKFPDMSLQKSRQSEGSTGTGTGIWRRRGKEIIEDLYRSWADVFNSAPGWQQLNNVSSNLVGEYPNYAQATQNPAVKILTNHLRDYCLQKFYQVMLGTKLDEHVFPDPSSTWTLEAFGDAFPRWWMANAHAKGKDPATGNVNLKEITRPFVPDNGAGYSILSTEQDQGNILPDEYKNPVPVNNEPLGPALVRYGTFHNVTSNSTSPVNIGEIEQRKRAARQLASTVWMQPTRWMSNVQCCKTFDRVFMIPVDPDWFAIDRDATPAELFDTLMTKGYIEEIQQVHPDGELTSTIYKVTRVPSNVGHGHPHPQQDLAGKRVQDEVTMDQFWVEVEYIDEHVTATTTAFPAPGTSGGSGTAGWV